MRCYADRACVATGSAACKPVVHPSMHVPALAEHLRVHLRQLADLLIRCVKLLGKPTRSALSLRCATLDSPTGTERAFYCQVHPHVVLRPLIAILPRVAIIAKIVFL